MLSWRDCSTAASAQGRFSQRDSSRLTHCRGGMIKARRSKRVVAAHTARLQSDFRLRAAGAVSMITLSFPKRSKSGSDILRPRAVRLGLFLGGNSSAAPSGRQAQFHSDPGEPNARPDLGAKLLGQQLEKRYSVDQTPRAHAGVSALGGVRSACCSPSMRISSSAVARPLPARPSQ